MADVFTDTLTRLATEVPGVEGAAFTDMDGEEIAVYPRQRREELRLCAAYQGIALRRLAQSEVRAGRGTVKSVLVRGDRGAILTLKVGDRYQLLVQFGPKAYPARAMAAARSAVSLLEQNI